MFFCSLVVNAQYFIENKGQWPAEVKYSVDIDGGIAFIQNDGIVFSLNERVEETEEKNSEVTSPHNHNAYTGKGHSFKLEFTNAIMNKNIISANEKAGKYNYFKGDKSNWASNCLAYSNLEFKNIIEGVDIQLYSSNKQLKWNFICKNKAAAEKIEWTYKGINAKVDRSNILILKSSIGKIEENLPVSYLKKDGKEISVQYQENRGNVFSLSVPADVNPNDSLVIDPVLIFSTYSGSFSDNFGYTATFDIEGFLYSGSSAFGNGYPKVLGSFDITFNGGRTDIAITKFDTSGKSLIYSTFLGGRGDDLPHSIIADSKGQLYVLGSTSSNNYPVTDNAFQPTFNGGVSANVIGLGINYTAGADIVISLINEDGSDLIASTYFGGTGNDGFISYLNGVENPIIYNYADEVRGEIDFDMNGDIIIATSTYSTDFPIDTNITVYQDSSKGKTDGVVIKLSPNLDYMWSTYLGGSGYDAAYSIEIDTNNNYVIAGGSTSSDLLFAQNGFQKNNGGGRIDGYIAVLTPDGKNAIAGTYWGGSSYDQIYFVDVNRDNEAVVFGQTEDNFGYFIQGSTDYKDPNSGLFISKFTIDLDSLAWSTTFGNGRNAPDLSPTAFLSDACDRIFISGWAGLTNGASEYQQSRLGVTTGLPTTPKAFQSSTDGSDVYFAIFDEQMDELLYASFFGGSVAREHVDGGTSRFDRKGIIYQAVCAGCRGSSDFPIKPSDAHSPLNRSSNCNLGVFKFDPELNSLVAEFKNDGPYCINDSVVFTNLSKNFVNSFWNFGDGSTSTELNPKHAYKSPGIYTVTLSSENINSCNLADQVSHTVTILAEPYPNDVDGNVCFGDMLKLDLSRNKEFKPFYSFTPSTGNPDEDKGIYSYTPSLGKDTIKLFYNVGRCFRNLDIFVNAFDIEPITLTDTILCNKGESVTFRADGGEFGNDFHWSTKSDFSNEINSNRSDSNYTRIINDNETLYLRVTTKYCTFEDQVSVQIINTILDLGDDIIVCNTSDTINLTPEIKSGSTNLTYLWQPLDLVDPSPNSRNVSVSTFDTTYYLTVSNNNCSVSDSVFIDVPDLLSEQLEIVVTDSTAIDDSYSLRAKSSNAFRPIKWSPSSLFDDPTLRNQKIIIFEDQFIYLTAQERGCIIQDSIFLKARLNINCGPPNIFVPNGFSPNGDDNNDEVLVRGQFISDLKLEIFDQWGQKVFETIDQQKGWDGVFKGKALNPAVFVYQLTALCINGQTYTEKGNLTLIR